MQTKYLCVLIHIWIKGEVGAPLNRFKPSSKIFYRPFQDFFCGSFMFLFCLMFAMSLCTSVYMCFVVTCWERADLLDLICGDYCEFVTFPLVSWVGCGTWLYQLLIFAPLLTSKFQVGLKSLLRQGLSEPDFYGDLVYKLKKIVGSNIFSAQFIKIISHYKKIGYNINVLQQTACLVVNPITVCNFAFLFNCTRMGQTSDSMMVPT